ncbi:MAG TPA: hypothetical protein VF049_05100 [Nocardioidaceae bacterium]
MLTSIVRRTPCHGVALAGGPARGWCPRCGTSYQLDDDRLTRAPGSAPLSRDRATSTCVAAADGAAAAELELDVRPADLVWDLAG